ncbi:hypothetical protein [Escherichia coli]|uniref:hypothetical protein n=1 Tax=Escherichia coli TaxID=562 RepID=UPI0019F53A9B|nr:hypothetical protein [Salmonella enterica subsp. enterica serovar Muenster]EGP2908748.1 hypothetical protein [Salmonella enterica subsp. enterica serovar Muenster]EHX6840570.1 hypothetical protein [Salmonella enterica subsp. enterica serovar Muenster]
MKFLKSIIASTVVMSSAAFAAEPSTGTSIDFSTLTAGVDFATVVTVLMSIAAGAIGIALALAGIRHIRGLVKAS